MGAVVVPQPRYFEESCKSVHLKILPSPLGRIGLVALANVLAQAITNTEPSRDSCISLAALSSFREMHSQAL